MSTYYIGADVHSNSTEIAIDKRGKIVARYSVPTSIPAIANVLDSLQGKKYFAIEEGPMSGWLYRNLSNKVDDFISSDPRRNKLIASDGDKDDKIDAAKLASLLRGGFLRSIHQSDDAGRAELKHWVSLYHDRVRDAVRSINKIRARCRMHGVKISRAALCNPGSRADWLLETNNRALATQLNMLWIGYDATARQVKLAKRQLALLGKKYEIIQFFGQLPGVGLIRATTLFAYLDTPWRFKKKNKLWKYCGVGLQRTTSGTDKKGKPKPARLKLPWAVNRTLKNAVLGATLSAINQKNNAFKEFYERMVQDGMITSNARHAVARKMLTTMWAMWKTNSPFDESLVFLSN
ncbi:MAG: transposase [Planctomycetes bacterium]|nr:transposase [Planctomycetota bacterium]